MAKKTKQANYTRLCEKTNSKPIPVLTYGGKETAIPNGMPRQVFVYGQPFDVIYHTRIYSDTKQRLRGIVIFGHRVIVIDPEQTLPMMREALHHEMAHVYLHHWQEKSPCMRKLTPLQVEEFCDLFAEAHYDATINNPNV